MLGIPTEDQVLIALEQVEDPELGVNIVDLGLVYSIDITDRKVHITMTITSPGCPLTDLLKKATSVTLCTAFPELASVFVEIIWAPAWSPMMMSWRAKEQLGWTR